MSTKAISIAILAVMVVEGFALARINLWLLFAFWLAVVIGFLVTSPRKFLFANTAVIAALLLHATRG